jgi:FKBP-type peptidyl-prolyl cis-trans isomerase 2
VVKIDYVGRLMDGTVFDSNEGRPPAEMAVNQVVPGFSEALQLMNKGSTYRVRIPPELGYGSQVPPGAPIPPNATLDFEITLVDARALTAQEAQQMREMEMMQMQQMQEQMEQMQQQGAAPEPGGEQSPRPEPETKGAAPSRR